MKKGFKIMKKILLGVFILIFVVMIGGFIAIKMVVTKDFVATKIEDNINGRIEIKDISVPLWAAFSGVTIEGFKIGYRDAEVVKPMAERTAMKNEVIGFKSFNFRVAIGALVTSLGKKFELKSLLFTEPVAHIVLAKAGGTNLDVILNKPKSKEDLKKEAEEAAAKKKEEKAKPKVVEKKEPSKPFDFRELPTEIKMGKIGIEGGHFTVNVEAMGQTIKLSRVSVLLRDILIDPKDLQNKNHVGLTTQFDLELQESKSGGIKSFKISYDLQGGIMPINPKTGGPAEAVTLKMGLKAGSFVTGLAVFDKLKDKTDVLSKAGIKLNFLQDTQTLSRDAYATIYYAGGVVTLKEPPALVTNDFEFRLSKDDFINVKSMDHHFRGDFAVAEKHTKQIQGELDRVIGSAVGPALEQVPAGAIRDQLKASLTPEKIRNSVLAPAMKNGTLTLGVDSSAIVTSPIVKITHPVFPDLKTMLANELNKALGDLKGILLAELNKLKEKMLGEINAFKDKALADANKEIDKAKGQLNAGVDQAKAKGDEAKAKADAAQAQAQAEAQRKQQEAQAEADRQRAAAEAEARRKAEEEAKKNLPSIPGF